MRDGTRHGREVDARVAGDTGYAREGGNRESPPDAVTTSTPAIGIMTVRTLACIVFIWAVFQMAGLTVGLTHMAELGIAPAVRIVAVRALPTKVS